MPSTLLTMSGVGASADGVGACGLLAAVVCEGCEGCEGWRGASADRGGVGKPGLSGAVGCSGALAGKPVLVRLG